MIWETGRAIRIATKMRRYSLDLFGISETQCRQSRQRKQSSGEFLFYDGHREVNISHIHKTLDWECSKRNGKHSYDGYLMTPEWSRNPSKQRKRSHWMSTKATHPLMIAAQTIRDCSPYYRNAQDRAWLSRRELNAKVEMDNTGYKRIRWRQ